MSRERKEGITMKKEDKINFKIENDILKNYVDTINLLKEPMSQIKEQLNQGSKLSEPIIKMQEQLKKYSIKFPNEQSKIFNDVINCFWNFH